METQRILDELTDHLGLYHRSASVTKTESRARQAVVEWMAGLTCEQRRAALTVVDASWMAILLMMQKLLTVEGTGTFFILPDLPVFPGEGNTGGIRSTRAGKGKMDDSTSHGQGGRPARSLGPRLRASSVSGVGKRGDQEGAKCGPPLPGLCFRRVRGLLKRLEEQQTSGRVLVSSIRLFHSEDGEGKCELRGTDQAGRVDSMVVTEDLVVNMGTFLDVMDDLSHHEFLQTPCVSTDSPWEEMPWLKGLGYYSLPAFVANKLEIALWKAWARAQGTKRPLKSLALRSKDNNQKGWVSNSLCNMNGNGAFASNVFERKQAVLDWWRKLPSKERVKIVNCAGALATKTEVLEIVGEAGAALGNMDSSKPRGRLNGVGSDLCDARSTGAHRRSLSDSEVTQHAKPGIVTEEGTAITPYLTGLQVLKELSESGCLGGNLEGMNFLREDDARWHFDSKLTSVHAFSDRVSRTVRNILVKLRNDYVQLELLGDESSGKGLKGGAGASTEVRGGKTKKKRRKSTSSPKAEVSKEEEKTCCSNPRPTTELRNERQQNECFLGEAEAQARRSDVEQPMGVSKAGQGGRQNLGKKGKRGMSKARRNDVNEGPEIVPNSEMNDKFSACKSLFKASCKPARAENGSSPRCPETSGNDSLESSASSVDQGACSSGSVGNCKVRRTPSNLTDSSPSKVRCYPAPPNQSSCNEVNVISRTADEMPLEGLGSTCSPGIDKCRHSLDCAFPTSVRESPVVTKNCHLSTKDSRKELEDCPECPTGGTHIPRVEAGEGIGVCDAGSHLESSRICFGTVDEALSVVKNCSSVSVLARSSVKSFAPEERVDAKHESDIGDRVTVEDNPKESFLSTGKDCQEEFEIFQGDGTSAMHPLNGVMRFPKTARQLDHANTRHLHYQQGPKFRSFPHEWPWSPQFGYFGAYLQPPATDWLQLDVGRGWPQRVEPSLLAFRNTAVLRQKGGLSENPTLRSVASRSKNLGNVDRCPLVQRSYSVSPAMDYAMASKEEPKLNVRPLYSPSPFSSAYAEIEANCQGRNVDDQESDDRWAYDTDADDFGVYKSGEYDDFDGYIVSEEEGERCSEDAADSNADYHQIFGGGVMYWNAADYGGLGYSRPGSMSSDDSSWARHEADLSAVLDDIVNHPTLQGSFPGRGCSSSNVPSCSPSPPPSSLSFEHLSPVGSSNSRHCLPRPGGNSGKFVQISNQGITPEDQQVRVPITLEVMEQMIADSSAQPILRPIVVVHDPTLSRQLEALRLQEAKSPHIVPRSRRDPAGYRKRPPSPVLRSVPPAPPPPPPSPVAGPRRRRGLMTARSGSSSPRHWGLVNWPHKDEQENYEDLVRGEGREGVLSAGCRRGSTTSNTPMHPLSGDLLRERLVAIPSMSLEQEHPDVSIPMKTTLLLSSTPARHLHLNEMLGLLHVEIEAFRSQVEAENKMRKPFINMAVKKVEHSLRVLWPRSRIHIFGSIATGLALPTSDVDLVVCLPPVRNLEPIKEAGILEGRNGIKETSLQHAARYLADQDWVKNDSMKTIENTMVPIIMMVAEILPHQCDVEDEDISPFSTTILKEFCEDSTTVEKKGLLQSEAIICKEDKDLEIDDIEGPWGRKNVRQLVHLDISFETPSHTGLRTAELVRELVGQYPPLSPLSLVLKQFLTDRSLDHPYTGGLSSYCLVLLITRFLQHQQHQQHQPFSSQNLGRLFMDFLHFFGCVFDPRRMGVRIRGGGMYVSRDRYNDIDPLYIEDPLHPNNNVGRNCFRILQCVKAFADGYSVLEKIFLEFSAGSEDAGKDVKNLEVLQMMLPCIMAKRSTNAE